MAGKADHRGFGHIRKLPSGRHQASYIGPDLARHSAPQTFEDKDAAVIWLNNERTLTQSEDWLPPKARRAAVNRDSFAAYAPAWVATRRTRKGPLKPRTAADYTKLLDNVLIPAFGTTKVRSITPEQVDVWFAGLNPKTPTQNAHAYALLKAICKTAVEKKILATNPCQITGAGNAKRVRKIEPATLEQLDTIVDEVPERYELMILFAAWCQLRFGELTELRRSDVDVTSGVVKIRRGVTWVDGSPVLGVPKSDAGIRDVAIPPHILPAVRKHLKLMPMAGKNALLFPAAGDPHKHMRPATLTKVYYRARKVAGREDLAFHHLRHTGATYAAQAGATLAELMNRLGHSTSSAALKYQHTAAGRDQVIAEALSRLAEKG